MLSSPRVGRVQCARQVEEIQGSVIDPAYKGQSWFASASGLPSLGIWVFQSHPFSYQCQQMGFVSAYEV